MSTPRPTADKLPLGVRLFYLIEYSLTRREHPHFHGPIEKWIRELAEGPAALPPGRLLDVGAGTGRHSIFFAQRGWDVTALEQHARAVATARKEAEKAGVSGQLRIIQGAASRLAELTEGTFDLALDVMGPLGDLPPSAREEYVRALASRVRPGGRFVAANWLPITELERTLGPAFKLEKTERCPPEDKFKASWLTFIRQG